MHNKSSQFYPYVHPAVTSYPLNEHACICIIIKHKTLCLCAFTVYAKCWGKMRLDLRFYLAKIKISRKKARENEKKEKNV